MDMIINGLAALTVLLVFATFVAQVLAPLRHSALWAAPAAPPLPKPMPRRAERTIPATPSPALIVELPATSDGDALLAA
jgi:hypothetical protein